MKEPAVYIVASKHNGTLYTGVTSNLPQRAWQHREGASPGFAARYGCKLLVWYERHEDMERAILREKQIKAGSRKKEAGADRVAEPGLARLVRGTSMTPGWIASPSARNDALFGLRHCERSDAIQRQPAA